MVCRWESSINNTPCRSESSVKSAKTRASPSITAFTTIMNRAVADSTTSTPKPSLRCCRSRSRKQGQKHYRVHLLAVNDQDAPPQVTGLAEVHLPAGVIHASKRKEQVGSFPREREVVVCPMAAR